MAREMTRAVVLVVNLMLTCRRYFGNLWGWSRGVLNSYGLLRDELQSSIFKLRWSGLLYLQCSIAMESVGVALRIVIFS